jgi:hypothetical protein
VFVWLRGFRDMSVRAAALEAFYGGPVWNSTATRPTRRCLTATRSNRRWADAPRRRALALRRRSRQRPGSPHPGGFSCSSWSAASANTRRRPDRAIAPVHIGHVADGEDDHAACAAPHGRDAATSRRGRHHGDRAVARTRTTRNHADLPPRRPRAQGTSAGPDEAAGQQTRPLLPARCAPRIPRRAVTGRRPPSGAGATDCASGDMRGAG